MAKSIKTRKKSGKSAVPSASIKLEGEASRSTIDLIRFKVVINDEKITMDVHLLNQRFVECVPSPKHLRKWEMIPEPVQNETKRRIKLFYAGE